SARELWHRQRFVTRTLPDALDEAWVRLHNLAFDLFDDLHQGLVGRGGKACFVTLLGYQAVDEVDLGPSALQDVLPGRRPTLVGHAGQALQHRRLDLLVGLLITLGGLAENVGL